MAGFCGWYVPRIQELQPETPPSGVSPKAFVAAFPAGHVVQTSAPDAENCPTLQFEQTLAPGPACVPGMHVLQLPSLPLLAWNWPTGHATQQLVSVSGFASNVPDGHAPPFVSHAMVKGTRARMAVTLQSSQRKKDYEVGEEQPRRQLRARGP